MKITLLGVGGSAGLPQIGGADGTGDWGLCNPSEPRNRRTRSSIVIETSDSKRILVDTSPDLRLQLTAARIPRIDAIIFTHAHADHIAGLDEVRILNRIAGRPLPAYADERTWSELHARFDYAFKPWTPPAFYRPVMDVHLIQPGQTMDIAGENIIFFNQDHGFIPSLGLRMGDIAYSTDVVRLDDAALAALAGIKIWVVDCFTAGPPHPTHANIDQVLAWAAKLKPTRVILTHMGPDMDYASLCANLPPGIEPGFDGMIIEAA